MTWIQRGFNVIVPAGLVSVCFLKIHSSGKINMFVLTICGMVVFFPGAGPLGTTIGSDN